MGHKETGRAPEAVRVPVDTRRGVIATRRRSSPCKEHGNRPDCTMPGGGTPWCGVLVMPANSRL